MSRKRMGKGFLFLLLVLLASVLFAAEQAQEKEKTENAATIGGANWAVLIGIEKYKNFPDLAYGTQDIKAVADELRKDFGFPEGNIISLVNKDATRSNIMATLGQFFEEPKKVTDQDQVFIFFATHDYERAHGGDQKLCYLVPYDGDMKNIQGTLISINELRDVAELIPAKHVLFVVEGCAAGMRVSMPPAYGFRDAALEKPSRQMIALQDHVESSESRAQSGFADLMLKALGGPADQDGNGLVTATELGNYMTARGSTGTDKIGTVVSAHLPVSTDNFLGDFIFRFTPAKLAELQKPKASVTETGTAGAPSGATTQPVTAPLQGAGQKPAEAMAMRTKPIESKPIDGPAVVYDATDVNVGEVAEGEKINCTYNLRNVGKEELKINSAKPG